ncbi:hypothetical protein KDW10_13310 [Burkholderia vietnamiensis]|uniref:hypothetical protein n=1 Tax=Burkholderia vietnamiensis TaxID=60552 RepID=UPI001BA00931|nr:hypothetical protein [Burkholderia vietnamiensis]MBR8358333.1 hypothetical protein [Burkholderia vietnamiensis]
MIQSYDIQIPAGGTQILEVGAQIFDFLSSGSAFDAIQVLPEFQQGNVTLKLGQGFDAGKVVNRWFVKNPGTTAINGTVVLSTAGFRNFRISGDVNVLDGGKSRTLTGKAFCATGGAPAVAGQYARVQLWNPATSTNRVILEAASFSAISANCSANLVPQSATITTPGEVGQPKLIGAAQSTAEVFTDTSAVAATGSMMQVSALQSSQTAFKLNEPIVIPPGFGLIVWASIANVQITCSFEWYEEPNT